MNKEKNNIFSGIGFGVINNFLNIVLPFVTRTIIINKLGVEYVGLGSLFSSLLQVLSLSELGFAAAISYMLYEPLANNNVEKVNAILAFYRKIYALIGTFILLIAVCIIPILHIFINGDLPGDMNLYILYSFYVLNTVGSYFVFAYKRIILSANRRYDIEMKIATLITIVQYVAQIIILIMVTNYYAYVIVIPITTVLGNCACSLVVNKLYPMFKCEGEISRDDLKGIIKNTGGAFFAKIGSIVFSSVDNIVISAFSGLTILGQYNNYYYVIASMIAIFAVIHNTIRPVIGNKVVTCSKDDLWKNFKQTNFVYMFFTSICCVCSYVLFQDFEIVWTGTTNILPEKIVTLLVIYFFSSRLYSLLVVYQEASGLLWQGKYIPIIASCVNLSVNILLVNVIGLSGVILSSIISSVFICFPGYVFILFKNLFKNRKYMMNFLIDCCVYTIVTLVGMKGLRALFDCFEVVDWVSLTIKGVVTLISTTLIMGVCYCWKAEMKQLLSHFKQKNNNGN